MAESILPSDTMVSRNNNEVDGENDTSFWGMEEVLIEGFSHVYGGKVKVDTTFFPVAKSTEMGQCDTKFDPTPPPKDKIIGATPDYLKYLKITSRSNHFPQLLPEFTNSCMDTTSNVFGNYPTAVPDYGIFESQMTPLLPSGGIKKLICRVGDGKTFKPGDEVLINYYVYVEGCVICVESNKRLNKPHLVELGKKQSYLPLIELATLSMTSKEVAAFVAIPKYSFGKFGIGTWISRDKRVLCIIEVLEKRGPSHIYSVYYMSSEDRKSLPFEKIYMYAVSKKVEGDRTSNSENIAISLRCYFQALACLCEAAPVSEKDTKMQLDLVHALHGNVFLICYRLDMFNLAYKFLKRNMNLTIEMSKKACDYFCCANMFFEQMNWEKAKFYIDKAVVHLMDNIHVKDLQKHINRAYAINNKENLPTSN